MALSGASGQRAIAALCAGFLEAKADAQLVAVMGEIDFVLKDLRILFQIRPLTLRARIRRLDDCFFKEALEWDGMP